MASARSIACVNSFERLQYAVPSVLGLPGGAPSKQQRACYIPKEMGERRVWDKWMSDQPKLDPAGLSKNMRIVVDRFVNRPYPTLPEKLSAHLEGLLDIIERITDAWRLFTQDNTHEFAPAIYHDERLLKSVRRLGRHTWTKYTQMRNSLDPKIRTVWWLAISRLRYALCHKENESEFRFVDLYEEPSFTANALLMHAPEVSVVACRWWQTYAGLFEETEVIPKGGASVPPVVESPAFPGILTHARVPALASISLMRTWNILLELQRGLNEIKWTSPVELLVLFLWHKCNVFLFEEEKAIQGQLDYPSFLDISAGENREIIKQPNTRFILETERILWRLLVAIDDWRRYSREAHSNVGHFYADYINGPDDNEAHRVGLSRDTARFVKLISTRVLAPHQQLGNSLSMIFQDTAVKYLLMPTEVEKYYECDPTVDRRPSVVIHKMRGGPSLGLICEYVQDALSYYFLLSDMTGAEIQMPPLADDQLSQFQRIARLLRPYALKLLLDALGANLTTRDSQSTVLLNEQQTKWAQMTKEDISIYELAEMRMPALMEEIRRRMEYTPKSTAENDDDDDDDDDQEYEKPGFDDDGHSELNWFLVPSFESVARDVPPTSRYLNRPSQSPTDPPFILCARGEYQVIHPTRCFIRTRDPIEAIYLAIEQYAKIEPNVMARQRKMPADLLDVFLEAQNAV